MHEGDRDAALAHGRMRAAPTARPATTAVAPTAATCSVARAKASGFGRTGLRQSPGARAGAVRTDRRMDQVDQPPSGSDASGDQSKRPERPTPQPAGWGVRAAAHPHSFKANQRRI